MSALQGGGERGHRVDAESAAGGHLIPISPNAASPDVAGTMTSPADGSRTTDLGPAFVCQGDGIISAPEVASTLQAQHGRGFALNAETADGQLVAYRKSARVNADPGSAETWVDDGLANTLNSFDVGDVRTTHAVVQATAVGGDIAHTLTHEGHDASEDGTGRGTPVVATEFHAFPSTGGSMGINKDSDRLSPTLRVGSGLGIASPPAIAFSHYSSDLSPGDVSPTMRSGTNVSGHAVAHGPAVRRLTPLECERLQGWPEVEGRGWTDIPWNGKDHAPDSKRYQACGNGVTATVAYWIAARLAEVLK